MSIDLEYVIRKDIRNNPIVREVDDAQQRDLLRAVVIAGVAMGLLLFAAVQPYRKLNAGMSVEKIKKDIAEEEAINRQLRLNVDTLLAPGDVERRARAMGLVMPSPAETLILERARPTSPTSAVVARVR